MAIEMGNLSIVSVLLEAKGIDVTLRNRIGKTGMEKKKPKKPNNLKQNILIAVLSQFAYRYTELHTLSL